MSKETAASGGVGFAGLLTLVFVAAKLWDRVDWSWWWVCSPLWISAGAAIGIAIVIGVFALLFVGIVGASDAIASRRRARTKRKAGLP